MSEKQTYRTTNDVPTERAVLEREYLVMRLALSMPSKKRIALVKAQRVLQGLSFKDSQITDALAAIQQALEEGGAA